MEKADLVENAKAWNLIGRAFKCGIPLEESLEFAEQRCQKPELRSVFRALIIDCNANKGARPKKTAKYDPIPDVVFELVYLGWITGTLDITLSIAVVWLRAHIAFENDLPFLAQLTEAVSQKFGGNPSIVLTCDPEQIINDCEVKLSMQFPFAENSISSKFRSLAIQIENGGNPDELIEQKSLSSLERAFYMTGYNSGTLHTSLRELADVIDCFSDPISTVS
jgi:type II secretory pathway component PulF